MLNALNQEYFFIMKEPITIIYVFGYFLFIKLISNFQIIYINILKKHCEKKTPFFEVFFLNC